MVVTAIERVFAVKHRFRHRQHGQTLVIQSPKYFTNCTGIQFARAKTILAQNYIEFAAECLGQSLLTNDEVFNRFIKVASNELLCLKMRTLLCIYVLESDLCQKLTHISAPSPHLKHHYRSWINIETRVRQFEG